MLIFDNVKMVEKAGYQQRAMNNQGIVIAHFQPSPPRSLIFDLWPSKARMEWIANVVMLKEILRKRDKSLKFLTALAVCRNISRGRKSLGIALAPNPQTENRGQNHFGDLD
jgi:hypothetical protein